MFPSLLILHIRKPHRNINMDFRTGIFQLFYMLILFCDIQFPQSMAVPASRAFQILSNNLDSPGIFRPLSPNFVGLYHKRKHTTSTTTTTTSTTSSSTSITTSATTSATANATTTTASSEPPTFTNPSEKSVLTSSAVPESSPGILTGILIDSDISTTTSSASQDSSTDEYTYDSQESSTVDYAYDSQETSREGSSYEEKQILGPLIPTSANNNGGVSGSTQSVLDAGLQVAPTSTIQLTVEISTRLPVKNSGKKKQRPFFKYSRKGLDGNVIHTRIKRDVEEAAEVPIEDERVTEAAEVPIEEEPVTEAAEVPIEDKPVTEATVTDNIEADTPGPEYQEQPDRIPKPPDGNESEGGGAGNAVAPVPAIPGNEDTAQHPGGSNRNSNPKHQYRLGEWKPVIDINSPLGIYHPVQLLYDKMYELLKTERQLLEHNLWKEKIKARRELVLGRQIVD